MNIRIRDKKVHISVLHLAAFMLVYIINILLFLIFRGYTFLLTWIFLTALVPCSFFTAWRLASSVEGYMIIEKETASPGELVEVIVSIHNSSYFCALKSIWHLNIGNSFYDTSDDHRLILSIPPRGDNRFPMTVTMTELGRIVFTCRKYNVCDLLGILSICSDCAMESCLFILPQSGNTVPAAIPEAPSGVAEFSESSRKGNDHSEVSDIRTYRIGDRPKDIHWKLSARNRELMVKDRISLSGSEHVLLLDLPSDKNGAEKLLTEGWHQITELLNSHLIIRLLVWNQNLFSFDGYSVGSPEDLVEAYCQIYQTMLSYRSSSLLRQYMRNCYPLLESYLCITQKKDTVRLEIWING